MTSVETLIEAMLLDMADQYQIHISTGHKTVADFKQVAEFYGGVCGRFVFGGVLPDDVYDRVVKENPDPKKLFHALIDEGHKDDCRHRIDWQGAFESETASSFYKFLTSLDSRFSSYWPQVYKRLNLPFQSGSVPPSRINFSPERDLTLSRQLPASWADGPKVQVPSDSHAMNTFNEERAAKALKNATRRAERCPDGQHNRTPKGMTAKQYTGLLVLTCVIASLFVAN